MTTTTFLIVMTCILTAVTMCCCVALAYTVYRDTTKMEHNFKIQIAAAQASQAPKVHELPYQELIKIVNEVINYYTSQNMDVIGLASKNEDEISLILDELTADVSTKVRVSVSPLVSECILGYITEDFYDRYIFNSVRLLIVANIEKVKRSNRRKDTNRITKPKE